MTNATATMNQTPRLEIKINGGRAMVFVFGRIGDKFDDGITAIDLSRGLADFDGENIDVQISSPGGEAFEAVAIFNILNEHRATVSVKILGEAASAASLVAMAGDHIEMADNGLMMLHEPEAFAFGRASNLRAVTQMLEKLNKQVARIYQRSGASLRQVKEWMSAETWFDADEALEAGLIDAITESTDVRMSFDGFDYKNIPQSILDRNPTMADPKPKTDPVPVPPAQPVMKVDPPTPADPPIPTDPPTPVDPPDPAATPEPALEMTADQIKAEGKQEERKRVKQIQALCDMAECPEMSGKMIDAEFTVAEVQVTLGKILEKKRALVPDDSSSDPDMNTGVKDDDKPFIKEFEESAKMFAEVGMTQDEYVESRRIDEGLDVLAPTALAEA